MKTVLHYESAKVPARGSILVEASEPSMRKLAHASSYQPVNLKMKPGPFVVTLRCFGSGSSFEQESFDLRSKEKDGFELFEMKHQDAAHPTKINVENHSDEPADFEASMSVELFRGDKPLVAVDVMADDIADEVGAPRDVDDKARTPFSVDPRSHDGGDDVGGFSFTPDMKAAKSVRDRLREVFDSTIRVDVLGLKDATPSIREVVKSRLTSIVDNLLRTVDVVVRDAADKLDGQVDAGDAEDEILVPAAPPAVERNMVLGFQVEGDLPVAAMTSANITARPQVCYGMRKLIIPDEIAEAFDIVDIKVGHCSQFATAQSVPASVFAVSKGGEAITTDTCQISMNLTITVFNKTHEPKVFRAGAVGVIVEGAPYDYAATDRRAALISKLTRARSKRGTRPFPSFLS